MSASLQPRCNADTCVKCRNVFKQGDRVVPVQFVVKVGRAPDNHMQVGAWLSHEFELVHFDCTDPACERAPNSGIVLP